MNPIIYQIAKNVDPIIINQDNISFDKNQNPKLMKFGYSNITEELDLAALVTNSYYTTALNFDFSRKDPESIVVQAEKTFNTKNFNLTFAEYWEIITLFGLFKNNNPTIYSNNIDLIKNIITSYTNIADNKFRADVIKTPKKNQTASLVFFKYSENTEPNINIDENAALQFIGDNLEFLLNMQDVGSSMVLELYSLQTHVMVELIYYISSQYQEAFIIKPSATPEISDRVYLVLLKLKQSTQFSLPKHSKNTYLNSLGINPIPEDLVTTVQCFNSEIMPKKYKKYHEIKTYLDGKVYEGAVYQEMRQTQNKNAQEWINLFTNIISMEKLLDELLKKSDSKCMRYDKLMNILGK